MGFKFWKDQVSGLAGGYDLVSFYSIVKYDLS